MTAASMREMFNSNPELNRQETTNKRGFHELDFNDDLAHSNRNSLSFSQRVAGDIQINAYPTKLIFLLVSS